MITNAFLDYEHSEECTDFIIMCIFHFRFWWKRRMYWFYNNTFLFLYVYVITFFDSYNGLKVTSSFFIECI